MNEEFPQSPIVAPAPVSQSIQDRLPSWLRKYLPLMTGREKTALGVLGVILILSAFFSLTGFIGRHTHLIAKFGGTYREGAVGQPHYINPILAGANDLDLDLTTLVYSSLFRLDNNFQLENDLASEYSLSEDERVYTIHLRQDVRWHDGEPLTADDVLFTIRSIQTPDYGSPLISSFQGVQVDKIDDYTVTFTLKNPYAPFLTNLTVGIVPHHIWENISPKNAALSEQMLKPIGTGPFRFADVTTHRKTGEITAYRLIRNEGYYGQRPYLDQIVFNFYENQDAAVQDLVSGRLDGLSFLPLSQASKIEARRSFTVDHLLLPEYFGLFFNQGKSPALGDAGVRSALDLATDRQTIIKEALDGAAQPLSVPITQGFFNFDNLPTASYDPEKAKQNLDEAGWKVGADGIREKNGTKLSLRIATTDWPEYVKTAELVQQQWQAIGAEVQVDQFGAGTIQQTVVGPRDYEVLLYGEILPAQPDPYPFWHSTQTRSPGLNLSLLKDEKIDKLLEEARKISDVNARKEKYVEFIARISDIHPVIVLYQPYYLFAHDKSVGGNTLRNINLPAGRFADIENWFIKTKRVWGK